MNTSPPIDGAFLAMLQQQRRGECMNDLADAVRKLTTAVQLTGRAGDLVLKLTLRPASKGAGNALVIEDDIRLKEPKPEQPGSIFFADEDGNLLREDPRQLNMELRTVDGGQEPVRLAAAQNQ
jgi:hypothetical protein